MADKWSAGTTLSISNPPLPIRSLLTLSVAQPHTLRVAIDALLRPSSNRWAGRSRPPARSFERWRPDLRQAM